LLYAVAMQYFSAVAFHCAIIRVAIFEKPVALVQPVRIAIVPQRLFFAASVQRGEGISKKNSEMSCNFGEIIKKLYSL
jgi:hypothetical protein